MLADVSTSTSLDNQLPDTDPDRWVPLSGASNVRDLGGLPVRGGGTTRHGVLLRSDTLQELTDGDVHLLLGMGLATVLDLRAPLEAEREGRGRLAATAVAYRNLPFIGNAVVMADDPDHELIVSSRREQERAQHYLGYLDGGRESVLAALTTLAEPAASPALFHCAAGKDRTGVLAALVLDIVGVEREAVVADYTATNERIDAVLARLRRLPTYVGTVSDDPPEGLGADPATMRAFLDRLDADHGGAAGWALAHGADPELPERLTALLVG